MNRIVLLFVFLIAASVCKSQNMFFTDVSESSIRGTSNQRVLIPTKYRTVRLSTKGISSFLNGVPAEKNLIDRQNAPILQIPMPNGLMARFYIWESAAMDVELSSAYPSIKTFTGQGIDDPSATIKLDYTEFGFHAMILSPFQGAVFIDPYNNQTVDNYISYYKTDYKKKGSFFELTPIASTQFANTVAQNGNLTSSICVGSQLLTYRLVIACTHQYAVAATGLSTPTKGQTLAKIAISVNRVNGIYEKELSIRLQLVAADTNVIFTTLAIDPFKGNDDALILINESQRVIDSAVGTTNYDIGHTFSTGGGGYAQVGVICQNGAKSKGITGSATPTGDAYDVDYVAHEIGHQFGADHPFNSNLAGTACQGNGSLQSNAEPGSGSTIMAYAGICGADNLQANSDAQFHSINLNEIANYAANGLGYSCAVKTATGNTPPVVNAGLDYVIPKSTPFVLSGGATDANGDALSFSWEQIDVGGPFGTWNNPSGNAPLFRSFTPQATPVRYFPKLTDVINNATTIGEILPTYARKINFRLTARDNRAGGGGVCSDEILVTVSGSAGPFIVTYPNASNIVWYVNDFKKITWDPSGTTAAPINCANVKIELSTDGGNTFPITLIATTPNDGNEEIQVPNNVSASARVRVSAVGNVFYDISNVNFSIQNSPVNEFVFNNPLVTTICSNTITPVILKTGAYNGFSTAIDLSATGNPSGTTVTFGTSSLTPGNSTSVTLNNTNNLAAGTYTVSINGMAANISKSVLVSFIINGIAAAPSKLTAPLYNEVGLSLSPSFNWTSVSNADSYTLQIATTTNFSSIVQSINNITLLPYLLSTPLVENTIYYWRVLANNICGVGSPSYTGIFKTGIAICKNSVDVPKAIDSVGTPTIISTLTIPPQSAVTITDLNVVGLTGTHSFVGDIKVTLTSPAGTSVVLFDEICVDNSQDFNLNLDDEAANNITCPPTNGQTAKPQFLLSAFDGQNSAGVWKLTIQDKYNKDGGSLNGWGLEFNNCTTIATPISTTPYTQLCPPVSNTSLTSNLNGTNYQWQVNTGSSFVNIVNNANYAGTKTGTLSITNAPSSYNGFQYRCIVNGVNSQVLTVGFTNYWIGSVSNEWENVNNWNCKSIPDQYTDVIINSGSVIVKSNALCRSIKVNPNASVTINTGFKIFVAH